jgi:hypothetical protein
MDRPSARAIRRQKSENLARWRSCQHSCDLPGAPSAADLGVPRYARYFCANVIFLTLSDTGNTVPSAWETESN